MTLPDVQRLSNHWRRTPPLRVLVAGCAAALGVKWPDGTESKNKHLNAEEFGALVRATGGLNIGDGHG